MEKSRSNEMYISRHGPRLISNYSQLCDLPHFSLPTTNNYCHHVGRYAPDPPKTLRAQVGLLDRKAPKNLEHCLRLFYYKVSRGEEVERVSRGVKEEEERMQELSLDQLRDLNSKLMLITAGSEGKKEVERFSRTLGLLELVARHFLDLIQAGCHLFAQWTLKVIVICNSIRIPVWLICIGFIADPYPAF
jgi:hypothetical protein